MNLRNTLSKAKEVERDTPPPVLQWQPFPVRLFPEPVRSYITRSAEAMCCDASMIGVPMLSVLAGAIGTTRALKLRGGWLEYCICWAVVVAESGTLKSPAMDKALDPLRRIQDEEFQQYEEKRAQYRKKLANWEDLPKDSRPEKPTPPVCKRFIIVDITTEAVMPILQENPRGLLLGCDELAGWVNSFDAYKKGNGGDVSRWLSMHRGQGVIVDRKTGDERLLRVRRAAVSVAGTIQPGTMRRVFTAEHVENGLVARLLCTCPPRKPKKWSEAEVPEELIEQVDAVFEALTALDFVQDKEGNPAPQVVALSPEAKKAWIGFYEAHDREQRDLDDQDLMAAWAKLEAYAARFALIFHMIKVATGTAADPDVIDAESMRAGIELARWFAHEVQRVYAVLSETPEERERRLLVEKIREKGGKISGRDLSRCSRKHPTSELSETALQDLVSAGLGYWEPIPPRQKGGRSTQVFHLHSTVDVDTTPKNIGNSEVLSTAAVTDDGVPGEIEGEL